MPIDVRRFGVGHRRPEGPPGTTGIEGQVVHSGASGVIAELAFGRRARITPHANPNTSYFIVIEGGGWVGVGDERTRVQAGEAAVWPPDVPHAAWTDGAPMRAIVVEFPAPMPQLGAVQVGSPLIEGEPAPHVARGEGRLAPQPASPAGRAAGPGSEEGEPL